MFVWFSATVKLEITRSESSGRHTEVHLSFTTQRQNDKRYNMFDAQDD